MNKYMSKTRVAVSLAFIIIILGGTGLMRRCIHDSGEIVNEYVKPGGDTIAVAIEMSPLTYTMHNDTAEGFDYNMLRAIALQHHVTVEFFPVASLEDAFHGLNDGKYDMLVASLPATRTLKQHFPLTDSIYLDKQVLVQRVDCTGKAPVRSQEQLIGDSVWVAEGSPYNTRLRNMIRELGDTIVVIAEPGYSSEHLAIRTALGEVKQAVVNEAVARHIAEQYPCLDISTPISFTQFQVWAVAPGDSVLLDSLNHWVREFKDTPEYRSLADKYL